ncbi:unnamed protein product, partial [Didymodactylos carnosus]
MNKTFSATYKIPHVNGHYEYHTPTHERVQVKHETQTPLSNTTTKNEEEPMGNGHHSSSTEDMSQGKDVENWSSHDVKRWIKVQCKKFELKKIISEKFEMNGRGLSLLSKHDFIRRAPEGGEVLYYALQKLINPNKENAARLDQSLIRNSSRQYRIVELGSDAEEEIENGTSSSAPIVEEPDDVSSFSRSRQSRSDTAGSHHNSNNSFNNFRMPSHFIHPGMAYAHNQMMYGVAPRFYHPNAAFAHPQAFYHNHAHPHFHHPMTAPYQNYIGVFVEEIDNPATAANVSSNLHNTTAGEQLYLVTINGQ